MTPIKSLDIRHLFLSRINGSESIRVSLKGLYLNAQAGEVCGNVLMDNGSDGFEMTYFNNDSQSVSSPTGMCTRFETDRKQIVRTSSVASPNPNISRKDVHT